MQQKCHTFRLTNTCEQLLGLFKVAFLSHIQQPLPCTNSTATDTTKNSQDVDKGLSYMYFNGKERNKRQDVLTRKRFSSGSYIHLIIHIYIRGSMRQPTILVKLKLVLKGIYERIGLQQLFQPPFSIQFLDITMTHSAIYRIFTDINPCN